MNIITTSSCAALVGAAASAMFAVPASADSGESGSGVAPDAVSAGGCVSNAEYARLGVGQRLSYVRTVAGNDAQVGMRSWDRGAYGYHERQYTMCTPTDSVHSTLTTRFMYYRGAWRALLVDTLVGPEPR
jgi:hypothetical protein